MQNIKKDVPLSLICGLFSALFLILVVRNPHITEFQNLAGTKDLIWILLLVLPAIFFAGIIAARFFAKVAPVFSQIVKFVEVGLLNTFVDAGILNFLMGLTGITSGIGLVPMNTFSFLCAVTNSYFWNKLWTFRGSGAGGGKTFAQFIIVSVIGWGINTGILFSITTFIDPVFGLSSGAWANVAKVMAIFFSMVWNFLGYKFIVFKRTGNDKLGTI